MTAPRNPLEARYRRLLHLLPSGYRAVREQEMVDAFVRSSIDADPDLADLTLQSGWPGLRESASVVRLALRLRWADPRAPARYRVRAAGARAGTLAALTVLAVVAAQSVLGGMWFAFAPPHDFADGSPAQLLFGTDPDVWSLLRGWAFTLWMPAFVLAVVGGRRGASWASATAAVPTAVTVIVAATAPVDLGFEASGAALALVQLAVIAGLAGMAAARPAPAAPHRLRWLLAAAAGVVVLAVPTALATLLPAPRGLAVFGELIVDTAGIWCAATVIAAAAVVLRRSRGVHTGTATLFGLAGLAGAATVLRLSMLPTWIQYAHEDAPGSGLLLTSTAIQLGLTAASACMAGTLAARRIRGLPPVAYAPTGTAIVTT